MPPESTSVPASVWREDYDRMHAAMAAGRQSEAVDVADEILAGATDPFRRAQALLFAFGANLNLRNRQAAMDAMGRAADLLRRHPSYRLLGQFHALAAWLAHGTGSLETAGRHLVAGQRALSQMTELGKAAVTAWHDLAITYSVFGFHPQAEFALRAGHQTAQRSNMPTWEFSGCEVYIRRGVWRLHCGAESAGTASLQAAFRGLPQDLSQIPTNHLAWAHYANCRLRLLGEVPEVKTWSPNCDDSPEDFDLRILADVCVAISAGDGAAALRLLEDPRLRPDVVDAAEPHHLRARAHAVRGDFAAALDCERHATQVVYTQADRLRMLFMDNIGSLLDQEHLRHTAAAYADAALTDHLTSLPNRRHMERFVGQLLARGSDAMIGVLDLDAFKAVNDAYGHLTGDQVLQRVAGILARNLRLGDLLARCGGDEFVVVLPETDADTAARIGARIVEVVANEDWYALIPDTPVGISAGWARLNDYKAMSPALDAADKDMYRHKRHRRSRRLV